MNVDKSKQFIVMLVDDEDEFRHAAAKALSRRGFEVVEAPNGLEAIFQIEIQRPDIVVLDLKMPGLGGIETLNRIRQNEPDLPVVILTGHGEFQDVIAGIRLEITEFLQKPIDLDTLAERIRELLQQPRKPGNIKEKTIRELMVDPGEYPSILATQSVEDALRMFDDLFMSGELEASPRLRSILVENDAGEFVGLLRFHDLLYAIMPRFLQESPYTSYFTGMFLAQCKLIGKRKVEELLDSTVIVLAEAPLMEAVHLMQSHHLVSLPVMDDKELVGVLRERSVIREIIMNLP